MTTHNVDELGVTLRGPDRGGVTDGPDEKSGNPEPEPKRDGGSKRAIGNRNRAWCTAKQDRVGERAMHRRMETGDDFSVFHQTSAPPLNEKKERKKLEAAKAMERPNTIWISRRNPP